jgi:ABC-type transport system substrate-binding protein
MNADLANLLKQAAVTPGQDAREPLYKQAEQMAHDDIARLWLGHNNTPLIFSNKVSGYIAEPVGADYYEFVELAP